jgi:hypothetical protein
LNASPVGTFERSTSINISCKPREITYADRELLLGPVQAKTLGLEQTTRKSTGQWEGLPQKPRGGGVCGKSELSPQIRVLYRNQDSLNANIHFPTGCNCGRSHSGSKSEEIQGKIKTTLQAFAALFFWMSQGYFQLAA